MSVDDITGRTIAMIEHLGEAKVWGWKSRVAEQLGLAPQDVTMILNGKRRVAIGRAVKLAARAGIDARYFTEPVADPRYLAKDGDTGATITLGDRFVVLVDHLAGAKGWGWRTAVAKQLGLHPPDFTKLLKGDRPFGLALASKVAARVDLDLRFFTDPENTYGRWLEERGRMPGDPMVQREARVMGDLLMLDEETRTRVLAWANARW